MSSTILTVIVLVVMWLVVLVPMFVRRADEPVERGEFDGSDGYDTDGSASSDSSDRFDGARPREPAGSTAAARVLARRALTGRIDDVESEFDETDDLYGSAEGFSRPVDDLRGEAVADELDADGFEEAAAPRAARTRMIARRRRTLALLAALILGTLVLVLLARGRAGAWMIQVGCDLLLAGYLVGLRREAQRELVRRAARATAARTEAPARRAAHTPMPVHRTPPRPLRLGTRGAPPRPARGHLFLAEPDDPVDPVDPVEHRRVV